MAKGGNSLLIVYFSCVQLQDVCVFMCGMDSRVVKNSNQGYKADHAGQLRTCLDIKKNVDGYQEGRSQAYIKERRDQEFQPIRSLLLH